MITPPGVYSSSTSAYGCTVSIRYRVSVAVDDRRHPDAVGVVLVRDVARPGRIGDLGADHSVLGVPVVDGLVDGGRELRQRVAVVVVGVLRHHAGQGLGQEPVVGVVGVVGLALGRVVERQAVADRVVGVVDLSCGAIRVR